MLKKENERLDTLVKKRTKVIEEQKEEIMATNTELEEQKEEIMATNTELEEQKEEIIATNAELEEQKEEITQLLVKVSRTEEQCICYFCNVISKSIQTIDELDQLSISKVGKLT